MNCRWGRGWWMSARLSAHAYPAEGCLRCADAGSATGIPAALAGDARPAIRPLGKFHRTPHGAAEWLASPTNPQTARVMVNRLWHYHFGKGIVGTPSDFGVQGDRPSHPELLDYLALEFIKNGWSIKAMHRLIVNSATYRQSAGYDPIAAKT